MENSNTSAVPKGDLSDEQRADVTHEERAALEAELVQVCEKFLDDSTIALCIYIKTSEFFGKAKEKSVTVAQEAKEKVESTFTAIKNSETVKTINDKMGSAYSTVKDAIIHATYGHPPDD
ncbi:Tumor protein D52 [Fasciola gigantica]|uniref:Tumor protein D52 n=1 Tax=Fasciola gigantica TaxID=46835 RepID=A0A504YYM9_FASGI|nr:Tumor protein D52 [Fasciola gigantica]